MLTLKIKVLKNDLAKIWNKCDIMSNIYIQLFRHIFYKY